ncbi:MAG: hypothetical protein IKM91_06385 [Candidatus Methanomethylophilaceae archaeon]|nr:hypothetical protein [Candidatus Methanomethylophilaceae archaeon]MBR6871228.1 hypothetical protein [Candidatus Methanomethylophilaceae archaeon]
MGLIADAIIEGVIAGKEVIPLPFHVLKTRFVKELELVYNDPWLFNVESFYYHIVDDSVIDCCPVYCMGSPEYLRVSEAVMSKIDKVSRALKLEGKSNVEKVEAIHGFICRSMIWDDSP